MSLADRIKKVSTSKYTAPLGKVKIPNYRATTAVLAINIALQGDLNGCVTPGHTIIAGDSKHFKTSIALICGGAWLQKYPDAALLFIDTEYGTGEEVTDYFEACGVDTSRVIHCPVDDIEQIKFELTAQLKGLEKDDKLFVVIDSLGGAASRKEAEDADKGHSAQDMGLRAKAINSLWRIVTPLMKKTGTPIFSINHIYDGDHHAKVISGGRKILLSADDAWIVGRRQQKEGTEVSGYTFVLNVEKSRTVREKSKIPLDVTFEGGIKTHGPLFEIALEAGFITRTKVGWFAKTDPETGEVSGNSFRAKAADDPEFWNDIIEDKRFNEAIRKRYRLSKEGLLKAAEKAAEDFETVIDEATDGAADE